MRYLFITTVLFVFFYNNSDSKIESKVQYTASPPPYTPPASNPYHTAGAAPNQYPAPGPAPHGYGQPPAGYPPLPGYVIPQHGAGPPPQLQPQQRQQQQQVVVVNAGQQNQPVTVQHVQSYGGEIAFSCFVFWCCNPLFGLVAFILAG